MGHYFYDMIPADELAQLTYIPTMPEFVKWIGEKWADRPAVSDTVVTYTYKEMCSRIARRRAFLNGLGLQKVTRSPFWNSPLSMPLKCFWP